MICPCCHPCVPQGRQSDGSVAQIPSADHRAHPAWSQGWTRRPPRLRGRDLAGLSSQSRASRSGPLARERRRRCGLRAIRIASTMTRVAAPTGKPCRQRACSDAAIRGHVGQAGVNPWVASGHDRTVFVAMRGLGSIPPCRSGRRPRSSSCGLGLAGCRRLWTARRGWAAWGRPRAGSGAVLPLLRRRGRDPMASARRVTVLVRCAVGLGPCNLARC